MKKKLDELTYIGGRNIRDFVFGLNLTVVLLICAIGIAEALYTGDVQIGDMHMMIGILPFALIGIIYPVQIYTKSYHQKSKYYMITLKDVYYYHMKEFFNVKNVSVFLGIALAYDFVMTQILNYPLLHFFTQISVGFFISPLFVAIGFFITTIYVKGYKVMRGALYILTYIVSIPVVAMSFVYTNYYLLGVYFLIGVLSIYLFGLFVGLQQKRLEV